MKQLVVIDEHKESTIDLMLGSGVKLAEVSRVIGVHYDTLREKLKRRARGDENWHNRARIDHRAIWRKSKGYEPTADDERDDRRIKLFGLTEREHGVTLAESVRETGYTEDICRMELESFCRHADCGDRSIPAICFKKDGAYKAVTVRDGYRARSPGLFTLTY